MIVGPVQGQACMASYWLHSPKRKHPLQAIKATYAAVLLVSLHARTNCLPTWIVP